MPWKWWVPKALKLTLPEWFVYCTTAYSPIAISLGSYMDKAVGRRACTRKFFTHNVSVLSRWCLGLVSVLSRWCLGLGLVLLGWCLGSVGGCLDDVSVMSRSCRFWLGRCPGNGVVTSLSCLGHVWVMSRSCLGLVSVSSRWCLGLGLVWLEWCLGQCAGMSGWCLCVVSAVCQGWHGNVWLMLYRWCLEICLVMVSSCCFSDVSVTSQTQWCIGGVWVTLRWCIGDALVMSWSSVGDVWMMSRWCLGLVVFGWCPGNGAVMSLSDWREITCVYRTANVSCSEQNPLVVFWDFNIASTSETAREQARQTNKPTNIEEK